MALMEHTKVPYLVRPRTRRQQDEAFNKNGHSLKELQLSLRRTKVAELMLRGWTRIQLAEFFQVSTACIGHDIVYVRTEWVRERVANTDLFIQAELLKLDQDEHDIRRRILRLEDNQMEMVLKAYTHILRVMQRRAKMLGLDSPKKLQISVEQVKVVVQQIIAVVVDEVHDPDQRERIGHKILEIIAPHSPEEELK